jgi:hypothetical protein
VPTERERALLGTFHSGESRACAAAHELRITILTVLLDRGRAALLAHSG